MHLVEKMRVQLEIEKRVRESGRASYEKMRTRLEGEWGSEERSGKPCVKKQVRPEKEWGVCGSERRARSATAQARRQDRERAAQSAQMPRTT